jgi:hypothetical protein
LSLGQRMRRRDFIALSSAAAAWSIETRVQQPPQIRIDLLVFGCQVRRLKT